MVGQRNAKTKALALGLSFLLFFFVLSGLKTAFWGRTHETMPDPKEREHLGSVSMCAIPAPETGAMYQSGSVIRDVKHERESRIDLYFTVQGGVTEKNDVYGQMAFVKPSRFQQSLVTNTEVMRC